MPTLFESRFEQRAQAAIDRTFGVAVKLFRTDSHSTDAFVASYENQDYESIDFGAAIQIKSSFRNFFLPASSLVVSSAIIEPTKGMVLIEYERDSDYETLNAQVAAINAGTLTPTEHARWEIRHPPGRPAAELQPGGYRWLVHVQKIEDAA